MKPKLGVGLWIFLQTYYSVSGPLLIDWYIHRDSMRGLSLIDFGSTLRIFISHPKKMSTWQCLFSHSFTELVISIDLRLGYFVIPYQSVSLQIVSNEIDGMVFHANMQISWDTCRKPGTFSLFSLCIYSMEGIFSRRVRFLNLPILPDCP